MMMYVTFEYTDGKEMYTVLASAKVMKDKLFNVKVKFLDENNQRHEPEFHQNLLEDVVNHAIAELQDKLINREVEF